VCKNPWRLARGKRFPEIPEADGGGQAAPDYGLRSVVGAGFEPEGGHLVLLVADTQREMMQGAAKDGVGAIIEQLKRRYVAVLLHEHRRYAGEVVGQTRRRWRCCV